MKKVRCNETYTIWSHYGKIDVRKIAENIHEMFLAFSRWVRLEMFYFSFLWSLIGNIHY